MKNTGMTRPIDVLGRVVIPIEIRRAFELNPKDLVEIYTDDGKIVMTKYEPCCIFCGSTEELAQFHDKSVCKKCIAELR